MEKNHEGGSDAALADRETMAKALGTTVAFIEAMEKKVDPSQLPQALEAPRRHGCAMRCLPRSSR